MTAEIIPFPTKPKFAEGEISPLFERPGLPCTSFSVLVPIECLRPFCEAADFDVEVVDPDQRVSELLELFLSRDA